MNNHLLSYIPFFGVTNLYPTSFKVCELKSQVQISRTSNQQGFYKIFLITGNNIIHYADKRIETEGTNFFLGNAYTSYDWEFISGEQKGYACIFTEDFLKMFDYSNILQQSRLFGTNGIPVFTLNKELKNFITTIFIQMISEQSTNYIFKDELIHNWISLIMHEALKIKASSHSLSMEAHSM